ncbi:MAG: 1-acyl-sn-glycerol-3-phosphate acyltransferase [Oscillospiraceae bacterium]|nr:1-acyl-sn-glycerol-3-phosphate acyltransferase [Oscillospiraceae bacterium]
MTPSQRFYSRAFSIATFLFGLFFRFEVKGGENIPGGAAMVCANHSSWLDSVFLEFAFGRDDKVHIIGKAELFKIPVLAWFIKKIGMISIDRGTSDVGALRQSLEYLKNGEKVAIFPEGHRVPDDVSSSAKNGAVWLAERACAPIVPVYIPRKKLLFTKITLVIGRPYMVGEEGRRMRADERAAQAARLLDRILSLKPA